ncbi:MAG: hypothetical protein JWO37_3491 [Acidimicrobiales bacterium]|jgi:hypothetical protein|nr:hypothetical protein [Acidimicrobiales bacterium]
MQNLRATLPGGCRYLRSVLTRALAIAAAVTLAGCGSPSSTTDAATQRARDTRRLAAQAGLPPAVTDLLARYAASVGKTFSVTYDLGQGKSLVVWQRPPRRRVDAEGQRVYALADGTFGCAPTPPAGWRCLRSDTDASLAGPLDPDAVTRTLDALRASRGAFTLRTERRRIAGVTADCVVSEPKTAGAAKPSTLCLSREGAVLLGSGALLHAARYTTKVPASALALPAAPAP